MSLTSPMHIELLKDLLEKHTIDEPEETTSSDVSYEAAPKASTTRKIEKTLPRVEPKKIKDKYDIWDIDEVPEVSMPMVFADDTDSRVQPEYDFLFKQKVNTNDVFLGIDFESTPSVANSDYLVVKINLPKENSVDKITVDLTSTSLALTSTH